MKSLCNQRRFTYGKGRYAVFGCLNLLGSDAVLLIGGGEKPHAGCIVICEPDEANGGVTTSVYTFTAHREEVVARPIAEALCRLTGAKVVCVCGIHVDNATKSDIDLLVENTHKLGRMILEDSGIVKKKRKQKEWR